LIAIPTTYAKEGADQYSNGAENWLTGAAPPPGLYYINYFGYYSGELKNGSGDKANVGGTTPSVSAVFDAFRFIEITRFKIAGADYGLHIIVPVVYQSVNLGGTNSTTALGDITIDPMVLGWHFEHVHAIAGIDIHLPTGSYDRYDSRQCVGAHYYSFEPVLALSYLPKAGWEASTRLMSNIKTTNQFTNYHSGTELEADYLVGRHMRSWMVGASGYALKQVTDDTVAGRTVAAEPGFGMRDARARYSPSGQAQLHQQTPHDLHDAMAARDCGSQSLWRRQGLVQDGHPDRLRSSPLIRPLSPPRRRAVRSHSSQSRLEWAIRIQPKDGGRGRPSESRRVDGATFCAR